MIDYKIKIGLIPDVRDLGDFDTRKGMFEPAKGKKRKDEAIKYIKEKFADADIEVYHSGGLCSFYEEKGGLMIGFEH